MHRQSALILVCALMMAAPARAQEAKPAQPDMVAANQAVLSQLPFADRQDFEDATRGFIATIPDPQNQAYAVVNDGPVAPGAA